MKSFKKEVQLEFHKHKKQLIFLDKVISIAVIILLAIFRPDYVVIATFFLAILYLVLTQRKLLLKQFSLAFLVALIWMLIGKSQYGYNHAYLNIAGISLFPLFAWATGLFAIYLVYSHYEHKFHHLNFTKKFLLFLAFYWPLLIIGETVGYHLLNIQNVATSTYAGLPICNCMHAPNWMKAAYFLLGPIFFILAFIFKLENPHFKKL